MVLTQIYGFRADFRFFAKFWKDHEGSQPRNFRYQYLNMANIENFPSSLKLGNSATQTEICSKVYTN